MKTYNNLFEEIIAFENMLFAAIQAVKHKKFTMVMEKFACNFENELWTLLNELKTKTYTPGKYNEFYIYEPKKRMISAAPFRDRIVHHALCLIIEPIFENTFIFDSYANRTGKGTHRAINRYQIWSKTKKYVLKADVRKYFPCIVHEVLKKEIRKKIKCTDTLWLIDLIIDNSNIQEEVNFNFSGDNLFTNSEIRKGLPMGNLTSQFFANIFLNPLDHFVKEQLRCKHYIRYVDDFVLLADDKKTLPEIQNSVNSWKVHARFSDTFNLRLNIYNNFAHKGVNL